MTGGKGSAIRLSGVWKNYDITRPETESQSASSCILLELDGLDGDDGGGEDCENELQIYFSFTLVNISIEGLLSRSIGLLDQFPGALRQRFN